MTLGITNRPIIKCELLFLIDQSKCLSIGKKITSHIQYKLDGVGPVDNRPSPDYLHHFVHM